MQKFIDKFKNCFSSEESFKRVPSYLLFLCILLLGILIMLFRLEKAIDRVSFEQNRSVPFTKSENFDEVLDAYIEEPTKYEDYMPYHTETESSESNASEDMTTENASNKATYVINISSKKIHLPDCSFVNRTNEENKKTIQLSSDELNDYIKDGYTICKTCGGK